MPIHPYPSPSGPNNKRRHYLLPGVFLALAIAGAGFYAQHGGLAQDADGKPGDGRQRRFGGIDEAPVPVAVKTARRGDFPVYLTGLGTVTALRTVAVKPRVDGELVRVSFNEGQSVKAGELLAEIDPRPFQIQLQQAEGQLLRDEALLNNAEIDHQRYQTLLAQDSISAQQTATQAALVKQYRGNLEMDKAQVNNAKLQLSYAKLTAPIAGRAGLRQIDQGNIVHANDATGLVVITQLQPINVVFTLPEDKLPAALRRWRTSQTIKIEAYDRGGKTKLAEGQLQAIDNQIDPSTGTIKLKAQFDNREETLFANQFVNIKMQLETLTDVTEIPAAAIQHDNDGAYVFVAGPDNIARQRRVTVGPTDGDRVVVDSLADGAWVVVDGVDRLKDGGQVDIAEKDGAAVALKPEGQAKPERTPKKRDLRS